MKKIMRTRKLPMLLTLAAAILCPFSATTVQAIPVLQLYIEGATYDASTETWALDVNGGNTFRLWAIGNVAGPGSFGTIYDVKLAIAYDSADTPDFGITPSTTGGYNGFTDPLTPSAPSYRQTGADGSVPMYGDKYLPSHDVYGPGTSWQEFGLGDFTLHDSPIGDFQKSLLAAGAPAGQINVYDIMVKGTETVHFDLYDHVLSGTKAIAKFAPVSHDAEANDLSGAVAPNSVPDASSTVTLLGLALLGLAGLRRKFSQ